MEIAYVGSYTTPKRGGLERGGISVFSRSSEEQNWTEIQVYEMMNPSFLAFGRNKQNLYSVRADDCVITAFAIEPETGKLQYLNEKHIGFVNGVFLTTDAQSRYLFVASCSNGPGAVTSIRLNEDGSLGELCSIMIPKGTETGPLRPAQIGVRPHQICFDHDYQYLVESDKGLDEVNVFSVDYETGKLNQVSSTKLPMSSCPRHIAFHPTRPLAYLLAEWIGRVVSGTYENGVFTPFEIINTAPPSYVGRKNLGAEIAVHPNGNFVYASNRGHNSIAAFRVREDGGLDVIDWYSEGVAKPRFFALSEDGAWLYCANEEGHSVSVFAIDQQSGRMTFVDTVMQASAPACILFKKI